MNAFELATLASPIAGLAAGVVFSSGHSVGVKALTILAGALIGLVVYPGLVMMFSKPLDEWSQLGAEKPSRAARLVGIGILVYALAAPFVAWLLAAAAIPWLIRFVA